MTERVLAKARRYPLGTLPLAILFLLAFVVPLVNVISNSLSGPGGGVAGYGSTLTSSFFRSLASRTLVFGLITVTICVLLGYPTAYFAARAPKWLGAIVLALTVMPMFVNTVVKAFGWTVVFSGNGPGTAVARFFGYHSSLLFTPIAVILGLVQSFLPFMVLVLYASLVLVDKEVEEAAASLGSSPLATLRRVVLPATREGLIVGSTLVFALTVSSFIIPQMLGGGRQQTVVGRIYDLATGSSQSYTKAGQAAVIFTIAVMAIALIGTRIARRGNSR